MLISESRTGRRIIGRLDRGVDLFAALLAVCRERGVRTGEVRALGSLESAEVAAYDQAARRWKPGRVLSGGFEIVSLTGNLSEKDGALFLHAHAALMRDRDSGIEMLGGHLLAARVFAVEFVVEAFDDVILRRGVDEVTGLGLWTESVEIAPQRDVRVEARPVAAAPPADDDEALPPRFEPALPRVSLSPSSTSSGGGASWSQVAAASVKKGPVQSDDSAEEAIGPGDVIVHPTFGRCDVQRLEGDGEYAHVRLRNGRLVRLSLEVLRLSFSGQEDGKKVFRARVD